MNFRLRKTKSRFYYTPGRRVYIRRVRNSDYWDFGLFRFLFSKHKFGAMIFQKILEYLPKFPLFKKFVFYFRNQNTFLTGTRVSPRASGRGKVKYIIFLIPSIFPLTVTLLFFFCRRKLHFAKVCSIFLPEK